jgi:hypothetical protein
MYTFDQREFIPDRLWGLLFVRKVHDIDAEFWFHQLQSGYRKEIPGLACPKRQLAANRAGSRPSAGWLNVYRSVARILGVNP